MTTPAVEAAGLYAASARRVLRERGVRDLGERLRRGEDRLVFVVGSPRSGTTFLAGTLGAMPGFVDLSEVSPHKAAIPALAGLSEMQAAHRIRIVLERVRRLALVTGRRGVEQTPETAFVHAAALEGLSTRPGGPRGARRPRCRLLAPRAGLAERGQERWGRREARLRRRARFWVEPERNDEFEAASDATRAAWAWRSYLVAARSAGDERTLELRYETLASDPTGVAETIAAHLDCDPAPLIRGLGRFHDRSIGRYRVT